MRPHLVLITVLSVVAMAQSGMAGTPIPSDSPLLSEVASRVVGPAQVPGESLPGPLNFVLLLGGLGGLITAGSRADRLRSAHVPTS